MRRVSEREPAIRQFVIVKSKLMSVVNASVLLLITDVNLLNLLYLELSIRALPSSRDSVSPEAGARRLRQKTGEELGRGKKVLSLSRLAPVPYISSRRFFRSFVTNQTTGTKTIRAQ